MHDLDPHRPHLLGEIFAHPLVRMSRLDLTRHKRLAPSSSTPSMLPSQLFLSLAGIAGSVQNVKSKFLVPALGPVVYNLGIILGGWLLTPRIGVAGFAVGVLAGSFFGFFVLQLFGLRNVGARFTPNLDILNHPGFRIFLRLGIPIMLALSFDITDEWIIRWFGSYLTSASITWLTYARTLMRFRRIVIGSASWNRILPTPGAIALERRIGNIQPNDEYDFKGPHPFSCSAFGSGHRTEQAGIYFAFSHTRPERGGFSGHRSGPRPFLNWNFCQSGSNFVAREVFMRYTDTITPAVLGTTSLSELARFTGIARGSGISRAWRSLVPRSRLCLPRSRLSYWLLTTMKRESCSCVLKDVWRRLSW